MGYYIRDLKNKIQIPRWKVQYITSKKADSMESTAKKPRKEWDIRKFRWQALDFKDSMTLDQAQARALQLNARLENRRREERRYKLEKEGHAEVFQWKPTCCKIEK